MIKTIFVSSWRKDFRLPAIKMALISYVIPLFLLISHNILNDASRTTGACWHICQKMLHTIRGQPLTHWWKISTWLLINGEDLFVYLGRGVVSSLTFKIFSFLFFRFTYLFLFSLNLEESETFSISDCDSFFRILWNKPRSTHWLKLKLHRK